MQEIKLKPKFAEVIDNPALSTEEKLNFILKDTIEYYNINKRCTDDSYCYYSPETLNIQDESEGCAVGRLLTPESAKKIDETVLPKQNGSSISALAGYNSLYKDLVFPSFMVHNRKFFSDLQNLHDNIRYWDEEGNTKLGLQKVETIKKDFNLN